MKYQDEFRFKVTELGYTMTIVYDRWGGMKVIRESRTDNGTKKYQEYYFNKDAMVNIANSLLKSECGK